MSDAGRHETASPWTRIIGGALLGSVVVVFARPFGATLAHAGLVGVASAVAGGLWLPVPVLRRLGVLVPSLVFLVFVTCLLMYAAPGSPFASERVLAPQVEEALRARYGVPRSGLAFFAVYLKGLVIDGSLGPSLKVQGRSVAGLLLPALPVSLALGGIALALAVVLGVGVGVRAGLRPGSAADRASMALALVGISLPAFVVGALLVLVFALQLGWLPVAGSGTPAHLVLPAITLALPHAATIARLARSGTIEIMGQDFVRTARAKGLPERAVVLRHALPGALVPVVSYLGPATAGVLTGSFVVETLFGIPGMGQWFVKGAVNRDYAVVLGTTLIYAALLVLANLLVDLAYAKLDPRVTADSPAGSH